MTLTSLLAFLEDLINSFNDESHVSLSIDDDIDSVDAWDSLVTVAIASALQEEFKAELTLDDLERLTSVRQIAALMSVELGS